MAAAGPGPEDRAPRPNPEDRASEPGILRVLRNLDLAVIAIALPIFLAASIPLAGYAVGAGAWLAQRAIKLVVERRAAASDDTRATVGLLTAGMIGRGWLVAGAVFAVGLSDEDAGLAAAVLFLAAFTVSFALGLATRGPHPERP